MNTIYPPKYSSEIGWSLKAEYSWNQYGGCDSVLCKLCSSHSNQLLGAFGHSLQRQSLYCVRKCSIHMDPNFSAMQKTRFCSCPLGDFSRRCGNYNYLAFLLYIFVYITFKLWFDFTVVCLFYFLGQPFIFISHMGFELL